MHAAGTAEGTVVVWDFGTKGVAKKYMGHASAVTSVCWSRDGRYMASGSEDRNVILWDVLSGAEVGWVLKGFASLHVVPYPSVLLNPGSTLRIACSCD